MNNLNNAADCTIRKLLIVDDNPAIHEDIKKILHPLKEDADVAEVEALLFGTKANTVVQTQFRIDSAFQGQEGLAMVEKAVAEGAPYAMAFVDVRMPPGWDGIETIRHIWDKYPELQVVICTAYSDHSWEDIIRSLGQSDSLLILKKPFDNVEVLQLAHALTKKWDVTRQARTRMADLDEMVRLRTDALSQANELLQTEVGQRIKIEAALRASEERFQMAFRAASVPMAILHAETHVYLEVNDSFVKLTCRPSEEIVGQTPMALQLVDPAECDRLFQHLCQGRSVRDHSCRIRRHDGNVREVLVSVESVVLGDEPCLLTAMQDVTEHRLLEARLRQAQKMEAVGQLAAGVAHDFNNLLTVIHGHTSLQMARAGLDEQLAYSLNQVKLAADRAAALTRQLLTFSRKQVMQRKPLHLHEVIERLHPMLARLIGETIALVYDCEHDLPPVFADANSIEQIVMNLIVNARDATPDGGELRVVTELVTLDDAAVMARPDARPGQFICLSVADSGCGMDTAVMSRLFEPFFTTKPKGKGTGLGLSTVYGIAKHHEGWVEVESKRHVGSTFRVFLPVTDKPVAVENDHPIASPNSHAGKSGETVLVVEDEAQLREFMSTTLTKHGYRVLQAGDGLQAMLVWQTAKEPIDLLLTDMVMPNSVSGATLARRLLKKSNRLKVLYTSGYSIEVLENAERLVDGVNFLPKPFDVPKLIKAVRTCLSVQREEPLEAAVTAQEIYAI